MEKFNLKNLDLSKPAEQERFDKEYAQLKDWEKSRVQNEAESEAQREEWRRRVEGWKNDSEIAQEIHALEEHIAANQEGITAEIMEKVQDIMRPHFAQHGTEITSLPSIFQDGIFSRAQSDKYESQNTEKRRAVRSQPKHTWADTEEQGYGRVSTFSVVPLLTAFKDFENGRSESDIVVYDEETSRYLDNNSDEFKNHERMVREFEAKALKKIEEKIQKSLPSVRIENYVVYNDYFKHQPHFVIRVKLSHAVEVRKEMFTKVLLNRFRTILEYLNKYSLSEASKEFFKHIYDQLSQATPETFGQVYAQLDKINLIRSLLTDTYCRTWRDEASLLIDTNKVDDVVMEKELVWLTFQDTNDTVWKNWYTLGNFQHKTEVPIVGRVKPQWFAGLLVEAQSEGSVGFQKTLDQLTDIIKRINLEKAKNLSESDEKLIHKIQEDEEVDSKDLLLFASKVCNYNLLDENLDDRDLVKALGNYGRFPVYNSEGDLVWPKVMSNQEVRTFIDSNGEG